LGVLRWREIVLVGFAFNWIPYLRRAVRPTPHDRRGPFYRSCGNDFSTTEYEMQAVFAKYLFFCRNGVMAM
jgi:hypothetical protein